jgi:plasmid maintenance system killer protein
MPPSGHSAEGWGVQGQNNRGIDGVHAYAPAIRINDQFRLCVHWSATGAEKFEIVDYH